MKRRVVIIKIGGNVVDNPLLLESVARRIALLLHPSQTSFDGVVLVHGGGGVATDISKKLGVESTMVQGRRITSEQMRDICVMVYRGLVNTAVVRAVQQYVPSTKIVLGLSGIDGKCIRSTKRPPIEIDGERVDFGFVGDVQAVRAEFFRDILANHGLPVVAPLTITDEGVVLNTNADTIAQEIAVALSSLYEVELWYCFEKRGVLQDVQDENSIIATITPSDYASLKAKGIIAQGMIPKIENSFRAIGRGVQRVRICHANEITATENAPFGTIITDKLSANNETDN